MVFVSSETSAVLVTGIQAAGKSTIGQLLAGRFEKGAFIEGDLMRNLLVTGKFDMTPDPSAEAIEQLHLRYRNGALLVDSLVSGGFSAVHAEIILEEDVRRYTEWVKSRPLRIVILTPSPRSVVERELARGHNSYRDWIPPGGSVADAVDEFQEWINRTPDLGMRIDSTNQTPNATLDEIVARWDEALV